MASRFTLKPGREAPLGASLDGQGCNFVVWSPDATKVTLCLFDEQEREIERLVLRERKSHYWFGYVDGVKAGQAYGYRVEGPQQPESGWLFDEH